MKTYHSIKELFSIADENHCSPGEIACRVEAEEHDLSYEEVWERMKKTIPVFRQAIQRGLADTKKSAPVPAVFYRRYWRPWQKKKILR